MNHLEMITQVQKLFGDTTEAQIDKPFITSVLNAGQIDVARKTKCLPRRAETNIGAGVESYELPEDFLQIERVTLDGRHLTPVDMVTLDAIDSTRDLNADSTPTGFFTRGRVIYLHPTPATAGTGNLDIWYYKLPADLVDDDDISDLPASMHEDVVRYALARCKELDEDFAVAQLVTADYENRLITSRDEIFDDRADSYPSVRPLPEDLYY